MDASDPETWRGSMIGPLRRYADFRGRSGRREFWWFSLFLVLGYLAILAVSVAVAIVAPEAEDAIGFTVIGGWGLFFLGTFIPGLALTARRLHDLGLSGVLTVVAYFVILVTGGLGWFAYLIVMSLPGQRRDNRWGPPAGRRNLADVFA
jgi:uncharacterized membrane protein YhaH (DUF805 family)